MASLMTEARGAPGTPRPPPRDQLLVADRTCWPSRTSRETRRSQPVSRAGARAGRPDELELLLLLEFELLLLFEFELLLLFEFELLLLDELEELLPASVSSGVSLRDNLPADPVVVRGDRQRLNAGDGSSTIDNAVKYSDRGMTVDITLVTDEVDAVLTGAQSGRRHPTRGPALCLRSILPRPAERGQARIAGSGDLDCPIAKWIVEKHAGTVSVTSNRRGV